MSLPPASLSAHSATSSTMIIPPQQAADGQLPGTHGLITATMPPTSTVHSQLPAAQSTNGAAAAAQSQSSSSTPSRFDASDLASQSSSTGAGTGDGTEDASAGQHRGRSNSMNITPARINRPADVDSLIVYIDTQLDSALLEDLEPILKESYPLTFTDRVLIDVRNMIEKSGRRKDCYSSERQEQINAEQLLQLMLELWLPVTRNKLQTQTSYDANHTAGIIITAHDCYTPELNFVFGVARAGMGAVVSTCRLDNDKDFVLKEVTHEIGHVFGLSHCKLPCVMTFSDGVHEAHQKHTKLCDSCARKISVSTKQAANRKNDKQAPAAAS